MSIKYNEVFSSKSDEMAEACSQMAHDLGWDGDVTHCRMCNLTVHGFRDELSEREFLISGMCQKCQDDFFGV